MTLRAFTQKRHSKVDEKQMVPIWIFSVFLCHVLPDALEYLFGIFRRPGSEAGSNIAVDL